MAGPSTPKATFYFDFGSPYAYLSAERISGLFTDAGIAQPEWQPIDFGEMLREQGRSTWARGPERDKHVAEIERRAAAYGLPPIVWPDPWPAERLFAMRVATFAKQTGRTVSFALATFRQAFAAGRALNDPENVLVAAAACELHPRALLKAAETKAVIGALREATESATERGVTGIPTVVVDGEPFWGDDRLEEAVQAAS